METNVGALCTVATGIRSSSNTPEYSAGLDLAIKRGRLKLHESGTYVKLTQSGADLFA